MHVRLAGLVGGALSAWLICVALGLAWAPRVSLALVSVLLSFCGAVCELLRVLFHRRRHGRGMCHRITSRRGLMHSNQRLHLFAVKEYNYNTIFRDAVSESQL